MLIKLAEHKIKVILFTTLVMASLIAVSLLLARALYFSTFGIFLIWNLILAWIPLACAGAAYYLSTKPVKGIYTLVLACGVVWLLFFPNAPYILTDLLHLPYMAASATPGWYDVVMISWFVWTGQLLGVASMYIMQEIVAKKFGLRIGWVFSVGSIFLSGFGVYLGRFQRFNSWDVVNNPGPLVLEILDRIIHPASHPRTVLFTMFFSLLYLFIYFFIHAFGDLKTEVAKLNSELAR